MDKRQDLQKCEGCSEVSFFLMQCYVLCGDVTIATQNIKMSNGFPDPQFVCLSNDLSFVMRLQ